MPDHDRSNRRPNRLLEASASYSPTGAFEILRHAENSVGKPPDIYPFINLGKTGQPFHITPFVRRGRAGPERRVRSIGEIVMSMLATIADAIGGDATDKLVEDFAGTRLYVPQAPGPDDPISRSIGLDAAQKLAQLYGGDRMDVPNPVNRRNEIVALRATGLSIESIARQLRCTTRRVYQVLAEARARKDRGGQWNGTIKTGIGGDGAAARRVP